MTTRFYCLATALGLLLTACGTDKPNDADQLAFNDFEKYKGWVGDMPLGALSKAQAHSGKYSTVVDGANEYSLGYSSLLGQISDTRPTHYKINAWVYLPVATSAAKLVLSITDEGAPAPVLYKEAILAKEVKEAGKWQQVSLTADMPANAKPTSKMLVYLWRAEATEPVYLDDLEIRQVP